MILPLLFAAATSAEVLDAPRVLFLTHSAGFEHGVIKRKAEGELAHAERAFVDFGGTAGFEIVPTKDCGELAPARLATYDAIVFYTTGELPIPDEGRGALLDWVRAGGAYVGVHCASDTFYKYAPYQAMVGGIFDGHPWHQDVDVRVEAPGHPSAAHLGSSFRIKDEIYQFRGFDRAPIEVVLSLDGASVDVAKGKRADRDYALAWCRPYGEGAAFYTALGHREEVWLDPRFQEHLIGGLRWALAGEDPRSVAPDGAVELMGATAAEHWKHKEGAAFAWKALDGGGFEVVPGTGDIVGTEAFGDVLLHLEFQVPPEGNSGLYLMGRYEVQIFDSYGRDELRKGDCAGIYDLAPSAVNACRPAGEWQRYDVRFRAPRFGDEGALTEHARITVWHNGVLVQDDRELPGPTPGGVAQDEVARAPLLLQDHTDPVRYRNFWVQSL